MENDNLIASMIVLIVFELALVLLWVAGMWKVFVKAGERGWAAIVPLYNMLVLLRISRRPAWWFSLFLYPTVINLTILIIIMNLGGPLPPFFQFVLYGSLLASAGGFFIILPMIYHGVSGRFGHGIGLTAGLFFLPFIFFPLLGFGKRTLIDDGQGKAQEKNREEWNSTPVDTVPNHRKEWVFSGFDTDGRTVRLGFGMADAEQDEKGLIIGRSAALAHLVVEDDTLSLRHARIMGSEGTLYIEDLNTTNGTTVDGHNAPPFKPVRMSHGSKIILGGVALSLTRDRT